MLKIRLDCIRILLVDAQIFANLMEALFGGSTGALTSSESEVPEVLGWEDFAPLLESCFSNPAKYNPFDFKETIAMQPPDRAPESGYQAADYDYTNCYYGHGYQQHYNWL